MNVQATTAVEAHARHGESSWWDEQKQLLLFMDCFGKRFFTYDPVTDESVEYALSWNPMAIVGNEDGSYIGCDEKSVYKIDKDFKNIQKFADIDNGLPTTRFNDCKCGPDGAYWMGTMGTLGEMNEGKLFRLTPEGSLSVVLDKVAISNGFGWTKDLSTVYYTDTMHHEIYAFDYSEEGALSNKRVVFHDDNLMPDGMTIDNQDHIWVALWKKGKAVCIDPENGSILHEVTVEGTNRTTSVCFGGKDYDILFITTSRHKQTDEEFAEQPASGNLFMAKIDGVKGKPLFRGKF